MGKTDYAERDTKVNVLAKKLLACQDYLRVGVVDPSFCPVPRQNSIPAGERVGSRYEYLRSKPQLSELRSSKLRTSETQHIEDGGGRAVSESGASAQAAPTAD